MKFLCRGFGRIATVLLFAVAFAILWAKAIEDGVSVSADGLVVIRRQTVSLFGKGPMALGGITHVTNDVYWGVTDWKRELWEIKLPIDPETGDAGPVVCRKMSVFDKVQDVEGVAYDRLDGNAWIAAEADCSVRRADPNSGKVKDALTLPPTVGRFRRDRGIESLAVSPDGKVLWTATEEALDVDGPIADRHEGSVVRLLRFRRDGALDPWMPDGQFVYRTDPIAGWGWVDFKGAHGGRSGLSEICVLDDGSLLALEREFSVVGFPRYRCRIYEVDMSEASDVSGVKALAGQKDLPVVGKRLLFSECGWTMYEGLCQGPDLRDGCGTLLLVSDGDRWSLRRILILTFERHSRLNK